MGDKEKDKYNDTGCLKKELTFTTLSIRRYCWEEILTIFVANLQMLNSVKLIFFETPCIYVWGGMGLGWMDGYYQRS